MVPSIFIGISVILLTYENVVNAQGNIYTPWGAWNQCSASCGGGTRWRYRNCIDWSNINCVNLWQSSACNTHSCNGGAVNGQWSNWGNWGSCSVTCGGGSRSRSRSCTNPPPSNGGSNCPGSGTETQQCNTQICVGRVDGQWSNWGNWGGCSVTCGGGSRSRSRSCTNPPPSNGGSNCPGSGTQNQPCNTQICVVRVDGQWSNWGNWGSCSVTCGGGSRSRSRSCTNPPPSNGGSNCPGLGAETQQCNTQICVVRVDGQWSTWGSWGSCSVTCGGGSRSRSRSCTNPPPSNGGSNCPGSRTENQQCNTQICGCRTGQTVFDNCGQRCVCTSTGTLTQCTRIRREFTSMSTTDRTRYIQTIKTASTDPRYKSRYDNLLTLHKNIFNSGIHGINHFLPWHRWFIVEYENLLRQVDCRFTVSYWDWSAVAGRPWGTSSRDLWFSGASGFGGDGTIGQCVRDGPFRQQIWQLIPSVTISRCLRRNFNGNPPNTVDVAILLNIPTARFRDFELMLRTPFHDIVHCLIGGTMCETDAAAAPEFFLHHGFIDKLWEDWQKRSTNHRNAFFPSVNGNMPSTSLRPSDLLDNLALPGGVRAEYAPIGNAQVRSIERTLQTISTRRLQMIPRIESSPLNERTIKLFNISKSDVERVKKLTNELFSPRVRKTSKSVQPVDQKLGFDHNILNL